MTGERRQSVALALERPEKLAAQLFCIVGSECDRSTCPVDRHDISGL